jgi:hypothetical protein
MEGVAVSHGYRAQGDNRRLMLAREYGLLHMRNPLENIKANRAIDRQRPMHCRTVDT